jgi:uncharacterized RDD family membrane protein YckC
MLEFNPYQPLSVSSINTTKKTTKENDFELAERDTRLWAFLVDVFMISIPVFLWIVFAFFLIRVELENHPIILNGVFSLLILILLMVFVINLVLLYRNGQTIGKRLFGIKIVRTNGNRTGLLRIILVRYFSLCLLIYLPFLSKILLIFLLLDALLIFQNSRQCWHDLIADTIVIKAT